MSKKSKLLIWGLSLFVVIVIASFIRLPFDGGSQEHAQTPEVEVDSTKDLKETIPAYSELDKEPHHTGSDDSQGNPVADIEQREDKEEFFCTTSTDEHQCELNLEVDFRPHLFAEGNMVKSRETGMLLTSSNFNDIFENINEQAESDASYVREQEFMHEIIEISQQIDGIDDSQLACDDSLCALLLKAQNLDAWEEFQSQFFDGSPSRLGNQFIAPLYTNLPEHDVEVRVIFFPGNINGVVESISH